MSSKAFLITISAETIDEVRVKIQALAEQFGASGVSGSYPVGTEVGSGSSSPEITDMAPAKRVGRPKKTEVESAPVATPQVQTATPLTDPSEMAAIAPATRDEALKALNALNTAKGLPVCMGILKEFGAGKFSELKVDDYGAFVARCAATLK